MDNEVLAVIPAYNEEQTVAGVIAGIRRTAPWADVVVVCDGCTDNTGDVARAEGVAVIVLPYNMGYGAALQTGFRYAVRKGYERVVHLDADGQHDPACIPDLLRPIARGEADVAIGSRFLKPGYRAGFMRRIGTLVFGWIASLLIGQRITDPTSGFQAMNRDALVRVFAGDHFPPDFPDADVVVMLHRAGFSIVEVPVEMHPRTGRKSMHSGLKPVYYTFKMFLSIFMSVLRKKP
ncbi:MAG: glycosyltransferase family 2 protein [Desulfatibacillaceae bacterium]